MKNKNKIIIVIVISIFFITGSGLLIDLYNENTTIKVYDEETKYFIESIDTQKNRINEAFKTLGSYNKETLKFELNSEFKNIEILVERNGELTTLYRQLISEDYGQKSALLKLYEQNLEEISCNIQEVNALICNPEKDYSLIDYKAVLETLSGNLPESYIEILTNYNKVYLFNNYRNSKEDSIYNINGKERIKEDYLNGLYYHLSVLDSVVLYLKELGTQIDVEIIDYS